MQNKIGIVVLNYNTLNETIDCISSIKKYTSIDYIIYVIDNMSPDNSYFALRQYFAKNENIKIIQAGQNGGYSAGNDVGIKFAIRDGCEIIFIVNSDIELLNDAFAIMSDTLQKEKSCLMIGPSIIDNNRNEIQIPRKKLTFKMFVLARHPFCQIPYFAKISNRLYEMPSDSILIFDGSVAGCCFGIRAEDFEKIGFLDENVFLYYEEDILAYKMSKLGKKAIVEPHAKVWHKENVSTNKEGKVFVQFHRWISVLYLLKVYAKIGKAKQVFIALWNTLTWVIMSIFSASYRRMLIEFWKKNWQIVTGNYKQ